MTVSTRNCWQTLAKWMIDISVKIDCASSKLPLIRNENYLLSEIQTINHFEPKNILNSLILLFANGKVLASFSLRSEGEKFLVPNELCESKAPQSKSIIIFRLSIRTECQNQVNFSLWSISIWSKPQRLIFVWVVSDCDGFSYTQNSNCNNNGPCP